MKQVPKWVGVLVLLGLFLNMAHIAAPSLAQTLKVVAGTPLALTSFGLSPLPVPPPQRPALGTECPLPYYTVSDTSAQTSVVVMNTSATTNTVKLYLWPTTGGSFSTGKVIQRSVPPYASTVFKASDLAAARPSAGDGTGWVLSTGRVTCLVRFETLGTTRGYLADYQPVAAPHLTFPLVKALRADLQPRLYIQNAEASTTITVRGQLLRGTTVLHSFEVNLAPHKVYIYNPTSYLGTGEASFQVEGLNEKLVAAALVQVDGTGKIVEAWSPMITGEGTNTAIAPRVGVHDEHITSELWLEHNDWHPNTGQLATYAGGPGPLRANPVRPARRAVGGQCRCKR